MFEADHSILRRMEETVQMQLVRLDLKEKKHVLWYDMNDLHVWGTLSVIKELFFFQRVWQTHEAVATVHEH